MYLDEPVGENSTLELGQLHSSGERPYIHRGICSKLENHFYDRAVLILECGLVCMVLYLFFDHFQNSILNDQLQGA